MMKKQYKAIFAFSVDPITKGHINIIERATQQFSPLLVAIGNNALKKYVFTLEERSTLAKEAMAHLSGVDVVHFNGLLTDLAYEHNIGVIIRGVRTISDFEFESILFQVGMSQRRGIEFYFLPTHPQYSHISSTAVKALVAESGIVTDYVPLNVKEALEKKILGQTVVGITGNIGAGKSHFCQSLVNLSSTLGVPISHIDLDQLVKDLLFLDNSEYANRAREKVCSYLPKELFSEEGLINDKRFSQHAFSDPAVLHRLTKDFLEPALYKLRKAQSGQRGIVLVESALFADLKLTEIVNNRLILIETPESEILARLNKRVYSDEDIRQRISSQLSSSEKVGVIERKIAEAKWGRCVKLSSHCSQDEAIHALKTVIGDGKELGDDY